MAWFTLLCLPERSGEVPDIFGKAPTAASLRLVPMDDDYPKAVRKMAAWLAHQCLDDDGCIVWRPVCGKNLRRARALAVLRDAVSRTFNKTRSMPECIALAAPACSNALELAMKIHYRYVGTGYPNADAQADWMLDDAALGAELGAFAPLKVEG